MRPGEAAEGGEETRRETEAPKRRPPAHFSKAATDIWERALHASKSMPMLALQRQDFAVATDVSAYSLVATTRALAPLLAAGAVDHPAAVHDSISESESESESESGLARAFALPSHSSVVAMTFEGGTRACYPYGVMGSAKAALESIARGLALELGPLGVTSNCVSPGPVDTLAARGIPGFANLREGS